MKREDIYLGNIKVCRDYRGYQTYGEKRVIGDHIIGKIKMGRVQHFVCIYEEQAILIKVDKNSYIPLSHIKSFKEELFANLGFGCNAIGCKPTMIEPFYVDENSVTPCFSNMKKAKIKVKDLREEQKLLKRNKAR